MKSKLLVTLGAAFLFSCAHTDHTVVNGNHTGANYTVNGDHPNTDRTVANAGEPEYSCDSLKSLDVKPEILTVWLLRRLAECNQFTTLNDLYNHHSLHLDALPSGYAAGAGAKVFDLSLGAATSLLDGVTGNQWKGKMFFPSTNPRETRGMNRIKSLFGPVVPMGSFVTKLIEKHPLIPDLESGNVVLLNYAHPARKKDPPIQEKILEIVQVYDLMVAVPGKYGPVFVGKTWLGNYSKKDGEFTAFDPNKLIAWYFLDFNAGALQQQLATDPDHFTETKINLPLVKETNIRY